MTSYRILLLALSSECLKVLGKDNVKIKNAGILVRGLVDSGNHGFCPVGRIKERNGRVFPGRIQTLQRVA